MTVERTGDGNTARILKCRNPTLEFLLMVVSAPRLNLTGNLWNDSPSLELPTAD